MKNTKKKNGAAAKGKGRATLSAQQTIPYLSMHPDGVCKLPGGLYTKTVEYEDINYSVASTEDQTAIFSGAVIVVIRFRDIDLIAAAGMGTTVDKGKLERQRTVKVVEE